MTLKKVAMGVLSQHAKRLTIVHGSDQCTILLVEGAEHSSLVSSIQARFQLPNNMFYLTEPDQNCLVPLTSALPDRLTLHVRSTDCATTSMLDANPDSSPTATCFYIGDQSGSTRKHRCLDQLPAGMKSNDCCHPKLPPQPAEPLPRWLSLPKMARVRHLGPDAGQSHPVPREQTASPMTESSAPSCSQLTSAESSSQAAEGAAKAEKGGGSHRAPSRLTSWNDKLQRLPEQMAELSAPLLPSSPLVSPRPPKPIYRQLRQAILDEDSHEDSDEDSPDPFLVGTSVCEPGAEPFFLVGSQDLALRSRMTTMESRDSQNDAVETMLDAVNRFERLNSDLANERTMLAWHRTCLAAMRTALAFVAVTALQSRWQDAAMTIAGAMSLVVIVTSVSGMIRYQRVKQILSMKDPPQKFGRPSNAWLNLLVLFASAATALAICVRAWDKE